MGIGVQPCCCGGRVDPEHVCTEPCSPGTFPNRMLIRIPPGAFVSINGCDPDNCPDMEGEFVLNRFERSGTPELFACYWRYDFPPTCGSFEMEEPTNRPCDAWVEFEALSWSAGSTEFEVRVVTGDTLLATFRGTVATGTADYDCMVQWNGTVDYRSDLSGDTSIACFSHCAAAVVVNPDPPFDITGPTLEFEVYD